MDQQEQPEVSSAGDKTTKPRRTLTQEQMEKLSKAREKSLVARKEEAQLKRDLKETEQLLARKRLESRLKEMKEEISPPPSTKPEEPKPKKQQRKKKKAPTPEPSSASSESEEEEEEEDHPPPPPPPPRKEKKVAATAMKQRILGRVENNAYNEWVHSLVRGY